MRNAFTCAGWIEALRSRKVSLYLIKHMMSYLSERRVGVNSEPAVMHFTMTGGVPQGLVLGPDLRKIMYNGVLTLKLPESSW